MANCVPWVCACCCRQDGCLFTEYYEWGKTTWLLTESASVKIFCQQKIVSSSMSALAGVPIKQPNVSHKNMIKKYIYLKGNAKGQKYFDNITKCLFRRWHKLSHCRILKLKYTYFSASKVPDEMRKNWGCIEGIGYQGVQLTNQGNLQAPGYWKASNTLAQISTALMQVT